MQEKPQNRITRIIVGFKCLFWSSRRIFSQRGERKQSPHSLECDGRGTIHKLNSGINYFNRLESYDSSVPPCSTTHSTNKLKIALNPHFNPPVFPLNPL